MVFYRISPYGRHEKAVDTYYIIMSHNKNIRTQAAVQLTENNVSYVEDEEHYTEVFKRMTEVEHSLRIASANLNNINVYVKTDNVEEKLQLCDFFLRLVERGVHIQVVCMKPFGFYLFAKVNCPQLLENPLFELRYNCHNHMKIFIFDDLPFSRIGVSGRNLFAIFTL